LEDPVKLNSLLLAAALAIPMIASAQSPATDKTDQKTPTKTIETAKLSTDEVKIVAHLHHVNQMEVKLGKQAKRKATAAVRRYADMLVRDHAKADKDLVAMAKKKGLARIPMAKPETETEKQEARDQMAQTKALLKLKGADFDREYLRMMVDGHEKELAKTDVFIASATDTDLKTMLEGRKTTLQRHADAAKELQQGEAQASATPPPAAKTAR
jgi:putative membrane protein